MRGQCMGDFSLSPPPQNFCTKKSLFTTSWEHLFCTRCFIVTVLREPPVSWEGASINWCFLCLYFHKLGFLMTNLHGVWGHRHNICPILPLWNVEIFRNRKMHGVNINPFSPAPSISASPVWSCPLPLLVRSTCSSPSSAQRTQAALTRPAQPSRCTSYPTPWRHSA